MLLALLVEAVRRPIAYFDTVTMLHGVARAEDCLRVGHHTGCDVYSGGDFGPVGPFPLLQYIPGGLFKSAGLTFQAGITGLAVISALAFAGTVALMWFAGQRLAGPRVAAVLVAAGVTGPLIYYATTAYGEALATFAVTLFVAAVLLRWPPAVVGLAAFGATITKDTALPLLLLVAAVAFVVSRPARPRRLGIAIVAGSALGIGAAAAWNVFRYGSPLNEYYLQPFFHVHDPVIRAKFLATLLVAPNGGLILFWAPALLVAIGLCVVAAKERPRLVAYAPLAIVALLLLGLSSWYAPFGWDAWGPRLALPWIPGVVLLAAAVAGRDAADRAVARALANGRRIAVAVLLCVVTALPTIGLVADSGRMPRWFGAGCPDPAKTPGDYYPCFLSKAWSRKPILTATAGGAATPEGLVLTALYAAALGSLLLIAARPARSAPRAPGPGVIRPATG